LPALGILLLFFHHLFHHHSAEGLWIEGGNGPGNVVLGICDYLQQHLGGFAADFLVGFRRPAAELLQSGTAGERPKGIRLAEPRQWGAQAHLAKKRMIWWTGRAKASDGKIYS
jgi:hypothetical protein